MHQNPTKPHERGINGELSWEQSCIKSKNIFETVKWSFVVNTNFSLKSIFFYIEF